jgi:hypothetical protein
MFSKAPPPTDAEQARMDLLREFGCVACHLDGKDEDHRYAGICDVHHFTRNNKRRGHDWTIGLCPSHHVGHVMSWHKTRRAFREKYGEDAALLAVANEQIGHQP